MEGGGNGGIVIVISSTSVDTFTTDLSGGDAGAGGIGGNGYPNIAANRGITGSNGTAGASGVYIKLTV